MILSVFLTCAFVLIVWLLLSRRRFNARPYLLLGAGPMASKLFDEMSGPERARFTGLVDRRRPSEGPLRSVPWLGPFDQLTEAVTRLRPSRIVVAIADRRGRLPLEQLLHTRVCGVIVEDVLEMYERVTGKVAIEELTPGALILARGFRHEDWEQMTSRLLSLVVAVTTLIVAAPLLAVVALAIKLDSRGSIFFVQERAGWHGKPFGLIKFRTMHASEERASEWVQDNAGRITRVGRVLRRFRIDEIPQMVNVILGDMDLVGPRPHPISNQKIFLANIAYYGLRSTVRPGITGWAQVRYGYANNLEQETEKMRYDLYYIKNHTLWLDLKILIETVAILVTGHGATEVRVPAARTPPVPVEARLRTAPAVER